MSDDQQTTLIPPVREKVRAVRRTPGLDDKTTGMAKEVMESQMSTETKLHLITLLTRRRKRG